MWTELVGDFEARVVDATQVGRPLVNLAAALAATPEHAAHALRLARAYVPLWEKSGTLPPPLDTQTLDCEGFSAEARAELAACAVAGLVRGTVPNAGAAHPLPGSGWREAFIGGSVEAEAKHNAHIAEQMRTLQAHGGTDGRPRRALHAKGQGLRARFTVAPTLAPELHVGLFQPGRTWDAVVRLSNAGSPDDDQPNLHGLAVRIFLESHDKPSTWQDFLATSAPVSHVADAADQALVGAALAPGLLKGALQLLFTRGPRFTLKVLGTLNRQTKKRAQSLATLSYYSRAPFRFGPIAARFLFRPVDAPAPTGTYQGPHRLTAELTDRLRAGPLRFELCLQRFINETQTPIEQGDFDWSAVPQEPIGVLEIPEQDLDAPDVEALARDIETWAFSPMNTRHHTPLGRLNRGRAVAYRASVEGRGSSIDR